MGLLRLCVGVSSIHLALIFAYATGSCELLILLSVGLVAPFAEEIICRGITQTELEDDIGETFESIFEEDLFDGDIEENVDIN